VSRGLGDVYKRQQRMGARGSLHFILRHYLSPADKSFGLERGSTDIDVRLPVITQ